MKIKIVLLLISNILFAQQSKEILTTIDSTKVKIGEEIKYGIKIKSDSLFFVEFPAKPFFTPFEIIEEKPIDTLKLKNKFILTKEYSLINFDSGRYWIPPQKVFVDGKSFFSDSLQVQVANVKVDTLKQPLFDIKPIVEVKKSYKGLIENIFLIICLIALILVLYFLYIKFQKKMEEIIDEQPPFEKAINALKDIEKEDLVKQKEFKIYYSKITEVLRKYLEEDAKVSALESTTGELIKSLRQQKKEGKLELKPETLETLKHVLENADLAKFALSQPKSEIAINDRNLIEKVVYDTKEAIPEPTQEEIEATAAFKREQLKKRRKKRFQLVGLGSLIVLVSISIGSILYFGYTPIKDTILRKPTKLLLDGNWIKSQYGTPPISIETPNVLLRDESTNKESTTYFYGKNYDDFRINLTFLQVEKQTNQKISKEEQEALLRKIMDFEVKSLEEKGAVNLLVQNDTFKTLDGTETLRLFGSMDLKNGNSFDRYRFVSLVFPLDEVKISLQIIFLKNDIYGEKIEKRIFDSLEIIRKI